ncbi:hypothetical protein Cgig2_021796 [Carnegiea gigantea]|uniref:Transposase MuDR plant domain-containing protein n=1 Tax=Carnegiea gigantea TaxID=171969 RepID=A0A9Q1KAN1_9CARY|nr:hypothetical protein Cgig2_021796 [Carnegiea gigantea]
MLLMIYAYYQDYDDTNSPVSSETDVDNDDGDKGRKQKKKKIITYPRYNAILSNKEVKLEVSLNFIDKEQLRQAVEDYRIMKGYDIRITHSDKKRFRTFCNGEGCEWFLWASKPQLMREENMEPTQFIHKCYSTVMLKKTYTHTLKPINGPNLWSPCEDQLIVAPVFKQKKKGNYQFKKRSKERESRPKSQYGVVSCSSGTVKCSLCKEYGHNKKTCRQRDSSTCTQSASAGPKTVYAVVTYVGATLGHTISIVSANASTTEATNEPIVASASQEPISETATAEAAAQFWVRITKSATQNHMFCAYLQRTKLPVRRYQP